MKKSSKKAFTIVETLVTLLAVTVMIAGPLTFMSRSYTYSEFVSSRVVALGLAQEALELATAARNINQPANTLVDIAANCNTGCSVDWDGTINPPVFVPCSDDGCVLRKTGTDSVSFTTGAGEETGYYRLIKFTNTEAITNGSPNGYSAEAIVWSHIDGRKIEIKLTKLIYNLSIK